MPPAPLPHGSLWDNSQLAAEDSSGMSELMRFIPSRERTGRRGERGRRFELSLRSQSPQAGEIESGASQRQFYRHFVQASQAEASQASRLFQHPNHRLHQGLSPAIASLPSRAAQAGSHAHMLGRIPRAPSWVSFCSFCCVSCNCSSSRSA